MTDKIIETREISDWEILSDDGWHDITHAHKTIKYDVWELKTENYSLKGADEHIVINSNYDQVFMMDLKVGDEIITETGIEKVTSIEKLDIEPEHMYDITVDSDSHTFYSNGILSHNTTMSTVFIVHYLLFNRDKTIAVLANKEKTAIEILRRIKEAYELLPLWLQVGLDRWNETSINTENGMRLICATTSEDSISGETVSLLYLDEFAKVKPHIAEEFISATLPVVASGETSKVIIVSCVTDDTFVITPDGIREVSDYVDYNQPDNGDIAYEVVDYEVMGHGGMKQGKLMCNSGLVETRIIKSPSSSIECSLRHPWFVCDNGEYVWKKTSELTGNEYIAIEYGHDVWGNMDTYNIQFEYNEIPKDVLSLNRESMVNFIRSYIELYGEFSLGRYSSTSYRTSSNEDCLCFYIKPHNISYMRTIRAILNNFGILSYSISDDSILSLDIFMFRKYVDIIGFNDNSRFTKDIISKKYNSYYKDYDSYDYIPYSKLLLSKNNISIDNEYSNDVEHYCRHELCDSKNKDFLLSLNNPEINKLYDYISPNIKWEKISNIIKSDNRVYDFSLNETGDEWCHSVLFNNILGSNTPKGMNHFYDYWKGATDPDPETRNNFYPIKVNWWEHPQRDDAWKDRQLKTFNNDMGKFLQEYDCRFLGSSNTLIDPDILERIETKQPIDLKYNGAMKVYEDPIDGAVYVMGVDTGKGTGRDSSVIQVLRIHSEKNIEQVAVYANNLVSPHDFAQVCIGVSEYYNQCYMMIENNGIGEALAQAIWYEYEYDYIINLDPKGLGVRSTTKTKLQANLLLKRYLDSKYLKVYDSETVTELSKYIEVRPNVYQAETSGTHDDRVTSLFWALYYLTTNYFDGESGEYSDDDEKYDITNSGPIMFLPE